MASKAVTVRILGNSKNLESALASADSKIGKFAKGAAVIGAALGAATVAAGVGLFKLGENFDEQFDKIRVGTGATGEALEGLQGEFKDVLRGVPASFDDAGTAIADLNTRLGLTGDQLQASSEQFINLSRITGVDLAGNIEQTSRTFGDWGVNVAEQGDALDYLYRTAQTTGVGLDQLNQNLVAYGAPLRQFGFSFEESAALLGQFQKEGVNTELVVGSLRQGLGKLARSGEDPIETLARVSDGIKNAGSTSEANSLALELFGARAGPDMAAAIREGRFEIDELMASLESGDTINQAAEDTASFSEKWLLFKNRVLVGLEPLATRVFDGMGVLMDELGPRIEPIIAAIGERLPAVIQSLQEQFAIWAPIVMEAFELVRAAIDELAERFEEWRPQIEQTLTDVVAIIQGVIDVIVTLWGEFGDDLIDIAEVVWNTISGVIEGATLIISGIVGAFAALFQGDWGKLWDSIKQIIDGAWTVITSLVRGAVGLLTNIIDGAMSAIWSVIEDTWNGQIKPFFSNLPGDIVSAIGSINATMRAVGLDIMNGLWNGLKAIWTSISNWIRDKINSIPDAFKSILGISSPSRVFMAIGDDIGAGLQIGLERSFADMDGVMAAHASTITTGFETGAPAGRAGIVIENYNAQRPPFEELVEIEARYGLIGVAA